VLDDKSQKKDDGTGLLVLGIGLIIFIPFFSVSVL